MYIVNETLSFKNKKSFFKNLFLFLIMSVCGRGVDGMCT